MKFVEAVKALGPGQLLIAPHGEKYKITNGYLEFADENRNKQLRCMEYLEEDSWQVIDKPRPRVRFADAMRAALEGKVIGTYRYNYKFDNEGVIVNAASGNVIPFTDKELAGDWEIIEAEGGK
jgi:hypothetical protein